MVLDEPSSNLDMAAIDDLRQVLSLWKKQGKTILIAEHRLYYLHDLADRVLYVKDGEIEREYTPAEFDSLSDGIRKENGAAAVFSLEVEACESVSGAYS